MQQAECLDKCDFDHYLVMFKNLDFNVLQVGLYFSV